MHPVVSDKIKKAILAENVRAADLTLLGYGLASIVPVDRVAGIVHLVRERPAERAGPNFEATGSTVDLRRSDSQTHETKRGHPTDSVKVEIIGYHFHACALV